MSDYLIELPHFEYNKSALIDYQKEIKDWRPNNHYTRAGIDTGKANSWFDYYPDKNNSVIKEITNNLNIDLLIQKPYKFTMHKLYTHNDWIYRNNFVTFHIEIIDVKFRSLPV